MRTDDSVGRIADGAPMLIRRSRGFVPAPLMMPAAGPPALACGAQLKSTFCVSAGPRAWLSHHIGDLENWETLRSFTTGIDHFLRLFRIEPEVIAHDLHPDYLSTRYAFECGAGRLIGVQHHHAHLAAVLAEHGSTSPAIGAIFDGTGYGTDGTVWGGELLVGDLRGFRRAGHLMTVRMPGGAAAIREPWRMACAWLRTLGLSAADPSLAARIGERRWRAVESVAGSAFASPITSSVGRLFDAASSLCGVRDTVTYEGQAAIELERVADPHEPQAYAMEVRQRVDGVIVIDPRLALAALVHELRDGVAVATAAARFHNGLAAGTAAACATIAAAESIETVALGGGVIQNALLTARLIEALRRQRLRVLLPLRIPPNDGGIAFGQAAVAAARSM
jgi:hydrogenase maturation protein HypF